MVDDHKQSQTSAKYKEALNRLCVAERAFLATLDEKQKDAYIELEHLHGETNSIELNNLAEFLYKHTREK